MYKRQVVQSRRTNDFFYREYKVVGVTFDTDGVSRQELLEKIDCHAPPFSGELRYGLVPYDFEGEQAIGCLLYTSVLIEGLPCKCALVDLVAAPDDRAEHGNTGVSEQRFALNDRRTVVPHRDQDARRAYARTYPPHSGDPVSYTHLLSAEFYPPSKFLSAVGNGDAASDQGQRFSASGGGGDSPAAP